MFNVKNVSMFAITNEGDGTWSFTHDGDGTTYYYASLKSANQQSRSHYIAWMEFIRKQIENFNRDTL